MHLKINIENDEELRNYIKQVIAGQVKSISREMIKVMVLDAIATKADTILEEKNLKAMIERSIDEIVRRHLAYNHYNGVSDKVLLALRQKTDEIVETTIKSYGLDDVIKNQIKRSIDDHVKKLFQGGL